MPYVTDTKEVVKRIKAFDGLSAKYMYLTLTDGFRIIGALATGDYMTPTPYNQETNTFARRQGQKLNIRSGRLARSIAGAFSGIGGNEGRREAFEKVIISGNTARGLKGSNTPYARIHEKGGTVRVTPRQRGFFFARYKETQESMWLALALSKTYTIPARPYLVPAAKDSIPFILKAAVMRTQERKNEGFKK